MIYAIYKVKTNDILNFDQKTNDRPTLKNRIKETKRHCLKLPPCFSRPYIFPQTYILFKSRVFKAIYVSQFLLITTLIWPRTESKWGTTYSLFTIYITAVIFYCFPIGNYIQQYIEGIITFYLVFVLTQYKHVEYIFKLLRPSWWLSLLSKQFQKLNLREDKTAYQHLLKLGRLLLGDMCRH
jgi:hypothetical protein